MRNRLFFACRNRIGAPLQILTEFSQCAHHLSPIPATERTGQLPLNENDSDLIDIHGDRRTHSFDEQPGYQKANARGYPTYFAVLLETLKVEQRQTPSVSDGLIFDPATWAR